MSDELKPMPPTWNDIRELVGRINALRDELDTRDKRLEEIAALCQDARLDIGETGNDALSYVKEIETIARGE